MLTREENELLCRVEGEAAMGMFMRRHWIPACMSEEVAEPDGAPVKLRLLGEDLVVFRDSDGRLGILDEKCPHRRASLALGRNEECGLRCLYHGWKMDVEGNVMEMASEPSESGFVEKVKMKAYPVREAGGFVWTYMGPAETMRDFEAPAFAPTADTKVSILKIHVDCNWAQVLEGQIDLLTPRACTRRICGRHALKERRRPRRTGCGHRPIKLRGFRLSGPALVSTMRRSAVRLPIRQPTITCAKPSTSRPSFA